MIARMLTAVRVRLSFLASLKSAPKSGRLRSRRHSARATIWTALAAFLIFTAGLSGALESARPEWRDPEFAVRLNHLRKWKAEAPRRPLVVAFGSSRTQMGLDPAAMNFPDRPGSPVVYNFGYRAAHPLGVYLHLTRTLDSGVKPDAVLVQVAAAEAMIAVSAEKQLTTWNPRFSLTDIKRLTPYTDDPAEFHSGWAKARWNPWRTYRETVLSDLLPEWQTPLQRVGFTWEFTDRYGFAPHPYTAVPEDIRAMQRPAVRRSHGRTFEAFTVGGNTEEVFRGLVARCRAEGIPVAFYWIPEGPIYRSWYSPRSREAVEAYGKRLGTELGVTVFPAPLHLEEPDFADSFHLLRHGAAKYSNWLAVHHLTPWLKANGVGE